MEASNHKSNCINQTDIKIVSNGEGVNWRDVLRFLIFEIDIHADEQRQNYNKICVPLNNAALGGDWLAAEKIILEYPEVVKMSITQKEETVLHIVASTKHIHFAEMLVKLMKDEDLELQNGEGATALCLAVASTVQMVDVLLKRNKGLLKIRKKGDLPFLCAVLSGDKQMVEHI